MLQIILGKGEDRRIRGGHPWIFSNEIREFKGDRYPGGTAEVLDVDGRYLGTGYYNPSSLIAVRLLSRQQADIDSPAFFRDRITKALEYRRAKYPTLDSYRVVFSEADFLPGLIVDRYGDYLAVQFLTRGIDARRDAIITALVDIFSPRGIVARNDTGARALEGLDDEVSVIYGEIPEKVMVREHGLVFMVDMIRGQKTGHFFDQKENHLVLEGISGKAAVLDCFCHTGSWGLRAALHGAASVSFVDVSERALTLARENAAMNGLTAPMRFLQADAFEQLRRYKTTGDSFDLVVLDPPAFIKSRKMVREGEKGYLTINRRAMELLRAGGYLVTCSCSFHMSREMFREMLGKAARLAGRELRLLECRSQAGDHPVLLNVPETEYLKCFLLQAV
jgi:23S rRNA (cytosine1962-C5)-methyltransferase